MQDSLPTGIFPSNCSPIPCPRSQFPYNPNPITHYYFKLVFITLTASPLELIVDADESWGSECLGRNIIRAGKVVAISQGSNRQAEHDVLVKGEGSLEGDLAAVPLEVLDGDADGEQRAAEVGDEEAGAVTVAVLGGGLNSAQIGTELKGLVLRLDAKGNAATLDLELLEDGDAERVDIEWARAWNNDVVVEKGVSKGADTGGQEWLLGGHSADKGAIEAILLTLLANDGCYTSNNARVSSDGSALADVLESGQDERSENSRNSNGVMDICDGELVFARQGGKLLELVQSGERIKSVQLLLLTELLV